MTQLSRQSSSVSHTGIATFCKAPYIFSPEELWPDADVAILGVPYDGMTSMRRL
jgi:arginase family enzyme